MQSKPSLEDNARRTKTLLWALVLVIALIISLLMMSGQLFFVFGFDTPNYILLAKSIALGHGYVDINNPAFPPHTQYPPGLPLLLAPVIYFLGYNLVWMHLIIVLFGLLSIYLIRPVFDPMDRGYRGIIIAVLMLTNYYFVFFTREILSEIPYMFFSLVAVLFFERYFAEESRVKYLYFFTLALVASYFVKMIGITLYAGAMAALALRVFEKRGHGRGSIPRLLGLGVAGILPLLLFMARGAMLSRDVNTYGAIFLKSNYYNAESSLTGPLAIFSRIAHNLATYLFLPARMLVSYIERLDAFPLPHFLANVLSLIILGVILYGLFSELYNKRGVKEFYVLFYLALLIIWPVYGIGDNFRYLTPVVPFLYYYLFIGMRLGASGITRLFERRAHGGARLAVYVCIAIMVLNLMANRKFFLSLEIPGRVHASTELLAGNLFRRFEGVDAEAVPTSALAGVRPCFAHYISSSYYLKSILRPDEVATGRKPWLTSLITGGYVLRFPFTADREKMLDFFIKQKIKYVVLDGCNRETHDYMVPFMKKYRKFFEATKKEYLVFKFNRPEGLP